MAGLLIDTNVLSELRRARPNRLVVEFIQKQKLENLFVSEISMAEIRFGAELQAGHEARIRILAWLEDVVRPMFAGRCLAANEEAWLIWKTLEHRGRRSRYTYSQPDLMIAALAFQHGLSVVTRDIEPFRRADVAFINPWLEQAD